MCRVAKLLSQFTNFEPTMQLQKSSGAGVSGGKYMIYLPDTGVKEDCVNSRDCDDKCKRFPETWQVNVHEIVTITVANAKTFTSPTQSKFTLQHRAWESGETNVGWNMVQGQTKQSFRRLFQGECGCLIFCTNRIGPRNAAESAALAGLIQQELTNHTRMTPQSLYKLYSFSTRQ